MLGQVVEAIVGLALLGAVVIVVLSCTPLGLWWLWPSPRREERSERVIIINNTPPAPSQPSGPGAGGVLALAVAALVVALTRRVDSQQALPAPSPDEWVEVEPGRWVRTGQTTIARRDDYRG